METGPGAVLTPVAAIGIHRLPRWEITRQDPPANGFHEDVKDCIEQSNDWGTLYSSGLAPGR
jgi:hypothetical protein